jgi:hypothetical protein
MVNPALKKQIKPLFAHPGTMKINEIRESFREGLFGNTAGHEGFSILASVNPRGCTL